VQINLQVTKSDTDKNAFQQCLLKGQGQLRIPSAVYLVQSQSKPIKGRGGSPWSHHFWGSRCWHRAVGHFPSDRRKQ